MRFPVLIVGLIGAGCGFQVSGGSLPDDGDIAPPDMQTDTPEDELPPDTDPPPPCPDGDSDDDGACNTVDACPGSNDQLDDDSDAVPDGCDTWPCGPVPVTPNNVVPWTNTFMGRSENVTLSDVRVDTEMTKLAIVTPGATFVVRADWSIYDCNCSNGSANCIDQIQVGIVTRTDPQCIYSGNPGGNNPDTCMTPTTENDDMVTLTAPTVEGVYEIGFRRGNGSNSYCASNPSWWDNIAPGPGEIIGRICVHAP